MKEILLIYIIKWNSMCIQGVSKIVKIGRRLLPDILVYKYIVYTCNEHSIGGVRWSRGNDTEEYDKNLLGQLFWFQFYHLIKLNKN